MLLYNATSRSSELELREELLCFNFNFWRGTVNITSVFH